MRVIAGAAKGRRLVAPKGDRTRPTADRVKESWFSSLQAVLPGARVLDLYAGSGGLGLEALSRGAAAVTFVENDRRALAALRTNLEAVGLPGATVLGRDVHAALVEELMDAPFDLVVADPPYATTEDELARVLAALVPQLAPGAIVTLERGRREPAPVWPSPLRAEDARRYGDTTLHRASLPAAVASSDQEPS
ncbi:MAG: 16S rRNA (guanine(966)-N(2))-methyltransferase RsmD [Nitriliruptor sp.]|uniref:16S rRNA (guanine(966)-N(2))-methyltransferase RsmD n=1 Tax=Nitriliruptor sp. TaxID=2448056 RepID=UPI0034A0A23C